MLEERKTNVEIEIALVDDKMAELRKVMEGDTRLASTETVQEMQ